MSFHVAGTAPQWPVAKAEEVKEIIARYPESRSALLPLLHLAQAERGYVAKEDVEAIADILGLTEGYVESVASFYAMYHQHPVGKYVITFCGNVACGIVGGDDLIAHIKQTLEIDNGDTTKDGLFTLEVTPECLAACDLGPVLQINTEYMVKVTPEKFDAMVAAVRRGEGPDAYLEKSEGVFVNGRFHSCSCGHKA